MSTWKRSAYLASLTMAYGCAAGSAGGGLRPAAIDDDCGPAIPGIDHVAKSGILLIGEMHGTNEAPALVGQLACQLARRVSVRVGLEIPTEEAHAVSRYLASAGGAEEESALLAGRFWTSPVQDGRSSVAMLGLLEALRRNRIEGKHIDVFLFDRADNADRDAVCPRRPSYWHRRMGTTVLFTWEASLLPLLQLGEPGLVKKPVSPTEAWNHASVEWRNYARSCV